MAISKLSKSVFALTLLLTLTSCGEASSSSTTSSEDVITDKQKILNIISKYENGEIETFDKGTFNLDLNGTTEQVVKGKQQHTVNHLSADFSNERAYIDLNSVLTEGKSTEELDVKGEIVDKFYTNVNMSGVRDSMVLIYLKGIGAEVSMKNKSALIKGYLDGVTVSKVLEGTLGITSIPVEGNLPKATLSEEVKSKINRELDRPKEELTYEVEEFKSVTKINLVYKSIAISELATEALKDDDPETADPVITVSDDAILKVNIELNDIFHLIQC